ncbi:MAG: MoaD/ThiS family protein [Bacillaceae bacterium]|nr:MoaD/ThiS family protein [Bacillaceae bacterium]
MKVKVFATYREICNAKELDIPLGDSPTVRAVLDRLIQQFPPMQEELFDEQGNLQPFVHVFVNGKNIIHGDGLETELKESDQVALFPPVGGG